jgi:probable rRNA maturation factor
MIDIDPPSSSLDLSTLHKSSLTRFFNRARAAVGVTGEVEVLLTSDAELKRLNRTFRGKNKATDVLSFPAPVDFPGVAGDMAISLETAARQASEHGHKLGDEVRILLLHGLLHLHGFDHETDGGEMAAREAELRRELRLAGGLIERAVRSSTKQEAEPPLAAKDDKRRTRAVAQERPACKQAAKTSASKAVRL